MVLCSYNLFKPPFYLLYSYSLWFPLKNYCILAGAQLWTPIFTPYAFLVQIGPNNTAFLICRKRIQNSCDNIVTVGSLRHKSTSNPTLLLLVSDCSEALDTPH